jgi:CubicO group peptidase (beta-lactamase class C family)
MRPPMFSFGAAALLMGSAGAWGKTETPAQAIDRYLRPYAETNNFSGVVLAASNGKPVFAKAYGLADLRARVPNTLDTRFHIASMSMQFTAAAALRLVMQRKLTLETPVSEFVPGLPNANAITIRHLLTQTSGIRDINGLPDYDAVLRSHQSPSSLVEKIAPLAPDRAPGTLGGEEHSAYNLLALIIERRTGLPFPAAVKKLVFDPLHMKNSGIDDDSVPPANSAVGSTPVGVTGLEPARPIHWSAKAGNASAYTTAGDELRFVQGMFDPSFLSPELRDQVFDLSQRAGYGWFKVVSKRFGEPVYSMNGRAPGFASASIYIPGKHLFIVALSNVYASFTPDIASDVTAALLDRAYEPLQMKRSADSASLTGLPARFRFGADFYQANAVLQVAAENGEVSIGWPTGDRTPMIPIATDKYVDRAYGVRVEIVRNADGRPLSLKYDRFTGEAEVGVSG